MASIEPRPRSIGCIASPAVHDSLMCLVLKYSYISLSYMQIIIMRQLVLWDCRTSILTKMEASGFGVIVLYLIS